MVTSTFPRWRGDSVPSFVFELAKGLSDRGVEIVILAPHARGARVYEKMDKVTVRRFYYFFPPYLEKLAYGGGVLPNLKRSLLARIELPFFLISQFLNVFWAVMTQKIDIVHSHWILPQGLINALVKKIIRLRHVLTVHAGMRVRRNIFSDAIIRFILGQADVITTNSQWNADRLSEIFSKKIDIIPMGVDLNKFTPLKRDDQLKRKLSNGSLLILGVGRWVEVKGYKYLIMAMEKVVKETSDVKLVLIGFGPEEGRLKRLTQRLNLIDKVSFIKGVGRDKINAYFASSDIFVLPSISRRDGSTEGFGLSLVEAMASEVPVIGSEVGGVKDIIKDGQTGLLAREKDPSNLAGKILSLIHNRELNHRLAKQGRDFVINNYSWDKICSEFYTCYERLLRDE